MKMLDLDTPGKAESRARNIAMVQRCKSLFDTRRGRLRCDWAELAGPGAPTLALLRERQLLGPGRYIGIDKNPEVFRGLEAGDDAVFHMGSMIPWMMSGKHRAGVLNWDSLRLGDGVSFERDLDAAFAFAQSQQETYGFLQFVLILNVGLDRGATEESFCQALAKRGHTVIQDADHWFLYEGKKSRRLNYTIIFGP